MMILKLAEEEKRNMFEYKPLCGLLTQNGNKNYFTEKKRTNAAHAPFKAIARPQYWTLPRKLNKL